MELIKKGMNYIYNYEFQKSQKVIGQLEASMEKSAVPDLMKALQVFWRHYPVFQKDEELELYQSYLNKSYLRSLEVLSLDPDNPEAIFMAMASQGLIAESYAESGRSFRAVRAAKRAYNYIKYGTRKMRSFEEFYLSTGLYNYYREYYPEAHPIYKPFMSFFMKGDKEVGIQQLEYAAKNASISHVIAKYYLSYIYMRYEYVPSEALRQGKNLHQSYPNNDLFSAIYLESLIINNIYNNVTVDLANKLQANRSPYLKIYGVLFMGIIEEKKNKDLSRAEKLYRQSLEIIDRYEMEQSHLEAYAYLGLGRIYQVKKDPQARDYFKESIDKAYTEALKKEAKSYLN